MKKKQWVVFTGPSKLEDGMIARLISDGEFVKSQVWKGGWMNGATVREVLLAPYATAKLLKERGIPQSKEGEPAWPTWK